MYDVVDELKTALEAAIGSSYNYYAGNVALLARSYMPAIMVFGRKSNYKAHSTAKHKKTHTVTIRVVQDVVEKLSEAGTGDIIKAERDLQLIMEEADSDGTPLATTIVGVLLRNIQGTDYLFHDDFDVEYETLQQNGFFYVSAEVTIQTTVDNILRS